jgi:hypothetical protein
MSYMSMLMSSCELTSLFHNLVSRCLKQWFGPGSTVVGHTTYILKIKGSNPATGTGRERMAGKEMVETNLHVIQDHVECLHAFLESSKLHIHIHKLGFVFSPLLAGCIGKGLDFSCGLNTTIDI